MKKLLLLPISVFLVFSLNARADNQKADNSGVIIPSDEEVVRELGKAGQAFLNPNSIKVLVWNIFKGDKEGWEPSFDRLKDDRDVLVLQEMLLDPQMETKLEADPFFQFISAISFIYDKDDFPATGVSTASVAKSNKTLWLRSPDREPLIKTPKMSLITVYNLYNSLEKLLVANVHGINFVRARVLARQLDQVFEKISQHKGPVILAGDFNTWTKRKMRTLKERAAKHLLKEVTYPNGDKRKSFMGNPLDHVFVRGLKTLSSQIVETKEASDHNAIQAEFSW
ncbi:MAG: endonuclease/exonuclease/phosphatase family protein [Bacteriovoracaceae bacterium]